MLWRVQRYLVAQRGIAAGLVDSLIRSGTLYADARANAVFLLSGTDGAPVGAISCFALAPGRRCISTAGARPNPPWLGELIAQTSAVFCGFDADATGDRMASEMIALHPSVKRLRPTHHDWNDVLRSQP